MAQSTEADWVARFADDVITEAGRRAAGAKIIVASGISPSGPIHLGNLREIMVPHLVADEIRRRGLECEHILSWDDFDRYRKVPAGYDPSFAQHIGKPLTSVPAPEGSEHATWSDHFKAPFRVALAQLGVEVTEISQTHEYTSGAYRDQILLAMRERARIDGVLGRYRTRKKTAEVQDDEDADAGTAAAYYPYKPYCGVCERDLTTVTAYDDETTELAYTCVCGHQDTVRLNAYDHGKLVWKVDWPMRWAFKGVMFEPSGVDHQSPGSSFMVGQQLVREIFGAEPPVGPMYAFVGISGMAKMSSSKGGVPTAEDALRIMEPQLLRWLYARRQPKQAFNISFDQEIQRTYDEWDALERRVAAGEAGAVDTAVHARAAGPAAGPLPTTPRPLPFRTLASVVDITTGDEEQTLRILRDFTTDSPVASLDETRPRLDKAEAWVTTHVEEDQRTRVRTAPDTEALDALDATDRAALKLLADGLAGNWSLDGLTSLVYAVPKIQAGLEPDAKPTPELKVAQRSFFALLYQLLVGRDTGPRLPTLLLAVGAQRVRELLGEA
ncbi:lysine--tRNA ligase [Streptantibioticus silvisoli]|uniref:Lysine--tRNA ligase n=1 Tax=Streptantibioticus silvisoli TaxID=2705255 RepID=A0ABT6W7G2_9ACTN|nr:lysine--tRNA ligase [Streptantibioticus silvisoli]MDI5966682.1 lysine--tRNA ligase [Streptantibioticus silvisoli]